MTDIFRRTLSAFEMQQLREREEQGALLGAGATSSASHPDSSKTRKPSLASDGRRPLSEQEAKEEIERRRAADGTAAEKVKAKVTAAWRGSEAYRTLAAHCWDRPRMSLADTMLLSPWQKWKKYNRVPWKVVLHALIFIVVTVQVLLAYVETSQYTRATHNTFEDLFLVQGADPDTTGVAMHTVEEVINSIKRTVDTYSEINTLAVDMFLQRHSDRDTLGDVRPIRMLYSAYDHDFFVLTNDTWDIQADDLGQTDMVFNLTQDSPFGPFNVSDPGQLQDAFHRMVKMSLSFNFVNLNVGVLGPIPFMWDVQLLYIKEGGQIKLELLLDKQIYYTTSIGLETQNIFTIFHSLVFALNFISFVFAIRAFFTNVITFLRTRRTYLAIPKRVMKEEKYPAWSRIPFSVKFEFFPLWNIHIMATSLFLMLASVLGIIEEFGYKTGMAYSIMEGVGALGASITILRYLEYYEHFYTLILTLRISGLRIARFIISAFPIFFGYMLMGVVLFSPYSNRFEDLNNTAITLFALLNGDDIRAAFEQLNENYPYPIVPTIYLYSFIALFITAILNIFIFIIEDSYHAAKISKRTQTKGASTAATGHSHSGGGGHSHGGDDGGRPGGARPQHAHTAQEMDIFDLFRILDREYNINDDDEDDDDMTPAEEIELVSKSSGGETDRGHAKEAKETGKEPGHHDKKKHHDEHGDKEKDEKKKKKTKKHKHRKQKRVALAWSDESEDDDDDDDDETEVGSAGSGSGRVGPAPSVFSINASTSDALNIGMASLLRQSLGAAAQTVERAASYESPRHTPPRLRRATEIGHMQPANTPRTFNMRITYKKLKRDLKEIVADQMAEFEEELSMQVLELQAKHTARLQKRVKGQLQKTFENLLLPGAAAMSAASWDSYARGLGASEYRESPF